MSPDPDEPPPRPLLGPAFWATVALGLVCVVAGAAFALLAARHPAPAPSAAAQPLGERPRSR